MFDIKEYYYNDFAPRDMRHDIAHIDEDISDDIGNLLSSRFDSLYSRDRYKNEGTVIEIIHPKLNYPGNHLLMLNPDRIRYLLSFYPKKSDFENIEKIVLRPRFIEIGNIELVSLYLRKKRILVLYLFHPHFYKTNASRFNSYNEFTEMELETLMSNRLMDNTVKRDDDMEIHVHPLWYLLSIISGSNDDSIDKFFIRKDNINDAIYEALTDISFYFSRHGY